MLETGTLPWSKMPTLFAGASLLGAPTALAYAIQAIGAGTLALANIRAQRSPGPLDIKVALTVTATCCLSPYLFDYDLALLAIPVAIVGRRAWLDQDTSWVPLLLAISIMPLLGPYLADATPYPGDGCRPVPALWSGMAASHGNTQQRGLRRVSGPGKSLGLIAGPGVRS